MAERTEIGTERLQELLSMLCGSGVFELAEGEEGSLIVPYLMNDAAEAMIELEHCLVPGGLPLPADGNPEAVVRAEVTEAGDRRGIVLYGEEGILGNLWYGRSFFRVGLYRYHRILHNWEPGYVHMRQIVGMLICIRDKERYLGPEACDETERSLIPLLHFRPFSSLVPLSGGWFEDFEDTGPGRERMLEAAERCGDRRLHCALSLGRPVQRLFPAWLTRRIGSSDALYAYLYGLLERSSLRYEERSFAPASRERLRRGREHCDRLLRERGMEGAYPDYVMGSRSFRVFEEYPFTVENLDDCSFDMHLLVHDPEDSKTPYRLADNMPPGSPLRETAEAIRSLFGEDGGEG